MQAKQMAESLQHLAAILEDCGNGQHSRILRKLAEAFSQAGSKAVSAVIRQVESRIPPNDEMNDSAATSLVRRMSLAVEAAGAKTPAKDFAEIADLLQKLGARSPDEVYEQITSALRPPPTPPKKAAGKPKVDVRALADELTSHVHDNEKFDELVERLGKLTKPVLASVAAVFLGYERAYKKKDEIIKAIRARQLQDAIEASRDRRISRIAV